MHSVRLEPTKLILIGTRTTYQATGDAPEYRSAYMTSSKEYLFVAPLLWSRSSVSAASFLDDAYDYSQTPTGADGRTAFHAVAHLVNGHLLQGAGEARGPAAGAASLACASTRWHKRACCVPTSFAP